MLPRTLMTLAVVFGTALSACQDKPPKDEYKFMEYVEVAGQCHENHVSQSAEYNGSLVHWFNVTKGQHSVYGSVTNVSDITPDKMAEQVMHPYKYYPPFLVGFDNLTPEQVAQAVFALSGISSHIICRAGKNDCSGPEYETTCNLKVVRRLDYLPDVADRAKSRE